MKQRRQGRKGSPETAGRGRWGRYLLMLLCVAVTASGFFLAARQHFASMDYGMRNSRLRRQIDDLEAEKRRLLVARETQLSPSEIKKAAKKAGLIGTAASETTVAQVIPAKLPSALSQPQPSGMAVETASTAAVPSAVTASLVRPGRIAKPAKKPIIDTQR